MPMWSMNPVRGKATSPTSMGIESGGRQGALEGGSIGRPAVRRQHVLDRQLEQRTQPRGNLPARHTGAEPPLVDLESVAEVDEGVARNHHALALDPEYGVVRLVPLEDIGAERQPIAGRVRPCVTLALSEQPDDVRTTLARLLGGDAVCVH